MLSFFQTPTLHLEMALRQYDDFLLLALFQHQTILSAVKSFGEDTDSCVLIGSAFEGCSLPKRISNGLRNAAEFDFFVRLPTPTAEDSMGTLQYTQLDGQSHKVLVKLSDPSIIESEYMGVKNMVSNFRASFLKQCKDGFYLKRNFVKTMEEKLDNSLGKVLVRKPGGMEVIPRLETDHSVELSASLNVTFSKPISKHLDMLPLDPDTWSGDAMTTAQMLWVNITNWSSSVWPTRIFKVHVVLECHWPADAMSNWLQRQRHWPSVKTVQEVAQTSCYLHPMWDMKEHTIDKELITFQMTFGRAEFLLFSETGPKERQCVVVLKALKEKYFHNSEVFTSFIIKMVFFWHLESTPLPERQRIGRGELLMCLLDKLIGFVQNNNLPHFFIPRVNLLEGFNADDINYTLRELKRVKRNICDYLTSELFQDKCLGTLNDDFVQNVLQFV